MGLLQNLLKVGGQAAGVAGAGLEGYAQDQTTQAARVLSQAKLEQEAQRNAVLNRIGLAGIDPTIQKSLAAAKSGGEVEGGTPGLAERSRILAPLDAKAAALKAAALAPIAVKQAVDTAGGVAPIEVKKAGDIVRAETPGLVDRAERMPEKPNISIQQPLNPGDPAQAVVIDASDSAHPKVVATAIPGVGKSGTAGANGPQMAAAKANYEAAIKTMDDYEAKLARGEATYGPLDATKGAIGSSEQAQTAKGILGPVESLVSNVAGASLRGDNPELANYLKAKKFLAEAALNTHKRPNQTQYEIEQELSGIGPRSEFISPEARAQIAQSAERRANFGRDVFGLGGGAGPVDHTKLSDAEFAKQYKAGAFNRPP